MLVQTWTNPCSWLPGPLSGFFLTVFFIMALIATVSFCLTRYFLQKQFQTKRAQREAEFAETYAALKEGEERFRILVSSVKDYAIFMLSPEGIVLSWNLGAEKFKGYKSEEIVGKHFSIFYTYADVKRGHPEHELESAKKDGYFEEEGTRVRKDGTLFLASVVITALYNSDGTIRGFSKITRDITDQKEAEKARFQALKKEVELTEAKSALKLREEFLSIASHELRTPLTPLSIQIQILARMINSQTTETLSIDLFKKTLKSCTVQLDSLTTLIEELFDFSRVSEGRLKMELNDCDLAQLTSEVIDRFSEQLASSGRLIEVQADPPVIGRCDKFRIEQVVVNLLTNAIKYGGTQPIKIRVWTEQAKAKISVQDSGIGIDKKDQERIFARFERAVSANRYGGLGLGLFIAREIVLNHGGQILLESELQKGSTFTVELPL